MKDEVYNFFKEIILKKGIWNLLLLNVEFFDIYLVEMINIKLEVDLDYIKLMEDDVLEKFSIYFVLEYVNIKEYIFFLFVLMFEELK